MNASPATNFLELTKTLQPVVSKWRLGCPADKIQHANGKNQEASKTITFKVLQVRHQRREGYQKR